MRVGIKPRFPVPLVLPMIVGLLFWSHGFPEELSLSFGWQWHCALWSWNPHNLLQAHLPKWQVLFMLWVTSKWENRGFGSWRPYPLPSLAWDICPPSDSSKLASTQSSSPLLRWRWMRNRHSRVKDEELMWWSRQELTSIQSAFPRTFVLPSEKHFEFLSKLETWKPVSILCLSHSIFLFHSHCQLQILLHCVWFLLLRRPYAQAWPKMPWIPWK